MKKPRIISSILLMVFLMTACKTNLNVVPSSSSKGYVKQEIMRYYLPKTELEVQVPVAKKKTSEGLVHEILKGLSSETEKQVVKDLLYVNFGVKVPDRTSAESYAIEGKVSLVPIAVRDEEKCFSLQYSGNKLKSFSSTLSVGKDGMINSGEFAQSDKTVELVTATVETVVGIISSIFLGNAPGVSSLSDQKALDLTKNTNLQTLINNTADNKLVSKLQRFVVLTNQLSDIFTKQAALNALVSSGVNGTDVYKLKSDTYKAQISAIVDELFGKTTKSITVYRFKLDPTVRQIRIHGNAEVNIPLLYFKKGQAPVRTSAKGEKYDDILKLKLTLSDVDFSHIEGYTDSIAPVYASDKKNFLYYNVPVKSKVQLTLNGGALASYQTKDQKEGASELDVYFPQLGMVRALPAEFDETKIEFYEDIGALKKVTYKLDAITEEQIRSAGTIVDTIVKYKEARDAANAPVVETETEEVEEVEEQVIRIIWDAGN